MSQSPPGYIPISVNDRYTAPPRRPDRVIGVELYLVACPPHPLDIGMYVHAYYVPEADARHYFPTTASRRPWRVASRMWGRLVGVCLQPGDQAVFEMEICNPESQIRLAHLHVDVYPGLTIDRRRWCSLMVAQLCRRLCVSICTPTAQSTALIFSRPTGAWMQMPQESVREDA